MLMSSIFAIEGGQIAMIVVLVVLIAAMVVVPMFTNKKKAKAVNELHASLEVGDTVTTIGGIVGKVVEVRVVSPTDKQFVLETGIGNSKSTMIFDINAIYLINNKPNAGMPQKTEKTDKKAEKADVDAQKSIDPAVSSTEEVSEISDVEEK